MELKSLSELLTQPEGKHLAFVRGRCKPDELAQTLVALANAQGGTVVIGAGGRGKKLEGVGDVAAAREAVLDAALACTPPLVLPLPEVAREGDAAVLLLSVPAGLPHVYSLHGKYLRREGPNDEPIPPDALRRLLMERGETSWERLVPDSAALQDLEQAKIDNYARRIGPAAEGDPLAFLFRRGALAKAAGSQQSAVGSQQAAGSRQQAAVSSQQAAVGSQQSAVGSQQAAGSSQQSAVSSQQSAVSSQQSAVSSQSAATGDRRLATGDWRLATGDQRLATGDQQLATGDQQLATGDQQLATGDWQLPIANYVPTNAGLLLFGWDVERFFPQCEITLVRYRGREMSDEFIREDVRDTLVEAVRRAEIWLGENMRRGSKMVSFERQDWVQFPMGAVREALVNAVAHRDYTVRGEGIRIALFGDRLECYSPGRLPGHVTLQNIQQERFSRNETLVQVLADYGLIERLGYGIDRMLRQMNDAGLPPPEFRETAAGFLVTLHGHVVEEHTDVEGVDVSEWRRMGLNERQIGGLLHLAEQRRITNRDLQDMAPDVSAETIRRDLADLVERGLLLKVGEKRGTYYILK